MKNVLVTGSNGFIGKNLVEALRRMRDVRVMRFDTDTDSALVDSYLESAEIIYHLAGVNRPKNREEYEIGNAVFTREIIMQIKRLRRSPVFVFASSTQAALDNPYGVSKRKAEEAIKVYAEENCAQVHIFRLPNVFGKWCQPNYNSVVATFCYNIAQGREITISDPSKKIELLYVDDVIRAFLSLLEQTPRPLTDGFASVSPTYTITLGDLAKVICSFKDSRSTLVVPNFHDRLTRSLYATYLTYLHQEDFAYSLNKRTDDRGSLAELLKSTSFGQVFVSKTHPGVTRGNHYHNTKAEKFIVVQGDALIRFRHILSDEVFLYKVSAEDFKVVDIPPGYTHSIENIGNSEMVVLFWANEVFDPELPDTILLKVVHE